MEQRVLDQLIVENIQLQNAERAGIRISDTQLNETLVNIARSNGMTLQEFQYTESKTDNQENPQINIEIAEKTICADFPKESDDLIFWSDEEDPAWDM